jgi:hypothetical protein
MIINVKSQYHSLQNLFSVFRVMLNKHWLPLTTKWNITSLPYHGVPTVVKFSCGEMSAHWPHNGVELHPAATSPCLSLNSPSSCMKSDLEDGASRFFWNIGDDLSTGQCHIAEDNKLSDTSVLWQEWVNSVVHWTILIWPDQHRKIQYIIRFQV